MTTLNLKGLDHSEKEGKIFPALDILKAGDSLKIVVEFNPIPLVYYLKARDGFSVAFEKEGPDEWILNVAKKNGSDIKGNFKTLLKEIKESGPTDETKKKVKEAFQNIDAKTLGIVEQELIEEGVSHDEVRKSLCDIHLEAIGEGLIAKRINVSSPHPVHTLMEEHKVINNTLQELKDFLVRLKERKSYEELGEDEDKLKDVAHHLVEAESHHQREEDVLFPLVEKHGVTEPPKIMKMDHVEFLKRKKELYKISQNPRDYDFTLFKQKVDELGGYLAEQLSSHIFKEDNILYQIALQELTEDEWKEVKHECDKIGYCCFTPEDQSGDGVEELDLRQIVAFERHDRIFESWEKLPVGKTLRIINDHDPKPLHYQFEAEMKDQYEWEYVQKGPKDWIVDIKKTG